MVYQFMSQKLRLSHVTISQHFDSKDTVTEILIMNDRPEVYVRRLTYLIHGYPLTQTQLAELLLVAVPVGMVSYFHGRRFLAISDITVPFWVFPQNIKRSLKTLAQLILSTLRIYFR